MKPNAPFLKILAVLSEKEMPLFAAFLESPFSVPYQQPIQFFAYLQNSKSTWCPLLHENRNHLAKAFHNNPKLKSLFSKQNISNHLFPEQAYNDLRIRRIIFHTKQALEKFHAMQVAFKETASPSRQSALLQSMLDEGHFVCLDAYANQFLKEQTKHGPSDEPEHFLFRFRRAMYQSEAALRGQNFQGTRFQEAEDFLDKFYFQQKMKLYAAKHVFQPLGPPETYTFDQEENHLIHLEASDYLGSPLIELYAQAVRMGSSAFGIGEFPDVLSKLLHHADQFSSYDLRQLTGFFLNFLDSHKFEGGTPIRRQIFSLLGMLLEREAIYIQGKIPVPSFNRVVFSALHLNELEWLEKFLLEHEDKVTGAHAQEVWELSMLRYTFELGAYQRVLSQLRIYHFLNPRFAIWGRIIQLKALVELAWEALGTDDAFDRAQDTFKAIAASRAFVKSRKGLHELHRESSLALLSKIHRLANLLFLEKGDRELLRVEVEAARESPFEQRWLLGKLDGLR